MTGRPALRGSATARPASGRQRVTVVLLAMSVCLVLASLATRYLAYRAEVDARGSAEAWVAVMTLFDVNSETNIPTWFSTALLLTGSLVLGAVAVMVRRAGGRDWTRWLTAAGVLSVLSMDEASALHERLGGPADAVFGGRIGHFAWVVPGLLLAVAVAVPFFGFLVRLPASIRQHLLGAGATFLAGAVAMEAVSGVLLDAYGDRAAYLLVTAVEEGLEMAGAVWLIHAALACLDVCAAPDGGFRLTLADARLIS